jgi:flagellar basal-body rod protein FlgB
MAISDLPILAMLKSRMQWHQERQQVLAENVANADTPGFRPHDLAPTQAAEPGQAFAALTLARTTAGHLAGSSAGTRARFPTDRSGYEVRPAGNAVILEEEMMKVAANQMDFQAATALYGRSLGLIKTALGKG